MLIPSQALLSFSHPASEKAGDARGAGRAQPGQLTPAAQRGMDGTLSIQTREKPARGLLLEN